MKEWIQNRIGTEGILLILGGVGLALSFMHITFWGFDAAWIAIIFCGIPILKEAVVGMVTEFDVKADVLVAMALVGAVIIGEDFAAGEVAFIMALGSLLEEKTVEKTKRELKKLVSTAPEKARVLKENEIEIMVDASKVQVGDKIRVLPGETIPVDGVILWGETSIDQSVMTGEPMPVDKKPGDELYSGTLNQMGGFIMEATKTGDDSSLQKMIRLVQEADADKSQIVGIADRMATWIVLLAVLSATFTFCVTKESIRAVTILVVFCPCALVLATPTAIMAAISNCTRKGILVRKGDGLERMSQIDTIAFDKTGTLTYGKPSLIHIEAAKNESKEELLKLTYSLERCSEHPLARALINQLGTLLTEPVTEFKLLGGLGVTGRIENNFIRIGNRKLLGAVSDEKTGLFLPEVSFPDELLASAVQWEQEGATVLFVAKEDRTLGFLVMEDVIRPDAAKTVDYLKGIGIECVMLTGDEKEAALHIGKTAGVDHIVSGLLPEEKLNWMKEAQKNGHKVAMIGDGVNDAPSLRQADAGIAMGSIGSDIAVEAADAALVRDELSALCHLFELSKKTMTTIRINIGISLVLNFVAIFLAMAGILNPVVGALVHNTGSVAVIIHSVLLLNWKKKEREALHFNNAENA
ncbi:MAG: cation-translocating P-type ATPase [Lachnospiraceae bacterium]|nr:cation-translocating P-type ATPase [Lachnospiraceae bacterium]